MVIFETKSSSSARNRLKIRMSESETRNPMRKQKIMSREMQFEPMSMSRIIKRDLPYKSYTGHLSMNVLKDTRKKNQKHCYASTRRKLTHAIFLLTRQFSPFNRLSNRTIETMLCLFYVITEWVWTCSESSMWWFGGELSKTASRRAQFLRKKE